MKVYVFIISLLIIAACGTNTSEQSTEEPDQITLVKAPASPEFADASLSLESLDVVQNDSTFNANFNFQVSNYELGVQTEDAANRGIANSGNGQHIHLIVNNGPYSAHYESNFSKEMEEGEYVVLAFLSRSYHESVKNPSAFFLDKITIGEPTETLEVDFDAPHLFYSRPKGTYVGADTEKLMIDFYLMNVTLSPNGNKVRVTVNDNEFLIDEWAPYYLQGLPKENITIKLELIDNGGNLIPGPFNSVQRNVALKEAE